MAQKKTENIRGMYFIKQKYGELKCERGQDLLFCSLDYCDVPCGNMRGCAWDARLALRKTAGLVLVTGEGFTRDVWP
jgi:hypothetical protein